jgi:hypothetical protein
MHRQKSKSNRTTKLGYRIKASKINNHRIYVVCVDKEIANFLIGCICRCEHGERIEITRCSIKDDKIRVCNARYRLEQLFGISE